MGRGLNPGPADTVCLSYTHDRDYKQLMPKKFQYHMAAKEELDAVSDSSTKASSTTQKAWVRVCAEVDVQEGQPKMLNLKDENLQVAVWRHRGKLYALDNRCAHMGGPLCEGDVEDLAAHIAVDKSIRLKGGAQKEDGVVKCPRHGQCFNLRTGENINGGHLRQQVYPVRVAEIKDVEVEGELEVRDSDVPGSVKSTPTAETPT